MLSSTKNKSVSVDFAVFLNTFLIVSTVIVFAVLLFVSYENMSNKHLTSEQVESSDICVMVASDYLYLHESSGDAEIADSNVNLHLKSALFEDKGDIYICDVNGTILFSNVSAPESSVPTSVSEKIYLAGNGLFQDTTFITGLRSEIVTISKIGNTGLYSVVLNHVDNTDLRYEYVEVILLPVLVSFVAAIALFVGFTVLMIRPLKNISTTVSSVAQGDFSARVDSKFTGDSDNMFVVSSDLMEMARVVNNMIESLENQESDRSIFISSIAHDIRTPLTSINGFVTAMLDGTIPQEMHEKYLLKIKSEVNRIRSLVVSMTEASSLSHVDPTLMEEFDFADMADDIISELEPQLQSKNIVSEIRIDRKENTLVYGEIQQLGRVVVNIVNNATKFTPENGKIILSATNDKSNNKMIITVEDSGPGVDPDKRNKVFESFYKVDPSRKQEGFGLGLYICKQILVGHGQSIVLEESQELGGAKFVFSFPLPKE
ncbi:MAG: HAMP domain-containing histidine kinase [Saccharofermentans sp.]|nr:HAMP domain-containing histidine kinase [Saccharofermentans sp.]